jgi:hypothetical protein
MTLQAGAAQPGAPTWRCGYLPARTCCACLRNDVLTDRLMLEPSWGTGCAVHAQGARRFDDLCSSRPRAPPLKSVYEGRCIASRDAMRWSHSSLLRVSASVLSMVCTCRCKRSTGVPGRRSEHSHHLHSHGLRREHWLICPFLPTKWVHDLKMGPCDLKTPTTSSPTRLALNCPRASTETFNPLTLYGIIRTVRTWASRTCATSSSSCVREHRVEHGSSLHV